MPDGNLRDEFNARLEAAEARTDARFVELKGSIDALAGVIAGRNGVLEQMGELRGEMRSVRADNRFTRYTILATAIGSTLAILGGFFALVQLDAAHQANLLAMFQTAVARR